MPPLRKPAAETRQQKRVHQSHVRGARQRRPPIARVAAVCTTIRSPPSVSAPLRCRQRLRTRDLYDDFLGESGALVCV